MNLLRLIVGTTAVACLGWTALSRGKTGGIFRIALSLATGLSVAGPLVVAVACLGLPSRARVLLPSELLLVIALLLLQKRRRAPAGGGVE